MTANLTVLIVDDDQWQRENIARQIVRLGHKATEAGDALEAIDLIDESALPDAIMLDIMLPGPNGIAFLHEVRSHADSALIPIVVCTASAQDLSLAQLGPYGVVAILDKSTMTHEDLETALHAAGL